MKKRENESREYGAPNYKTTVGLGGRTRRGRPLADEAAPGLAVVLADGSLSPVGDAAAQRLLIRRVLHRQYENLLPPVAS
jgi:hypothetical protein